MLSVLEERCVRNCVNSEFKKNLKRTIIRKRGAGVVETSFQFKSSFDFWNSEHHPSDLKSLLCDELCVLKFELWILKCDVEVVRTNSFFDREFPKRCEETHRSCEERSW